MTLTKLATFFAAVLLATSVDVADLRVTEPPKSAGLDPFYKKYLDLNGLPIVSSAKVSDYALKEAAFIISRVLENRRDLIEALIASKVNVAVMAPSERTCDIPEHSDLKPASYWNRRARGLGGPTVSCGEENLLNLPGDPYDAENVLIHEFAHAVHNQGLAKVDPDFNKKLKAAYDSALAKGLWKGTYAASDIQEYWAEGVQSWFDTNRHDDRAHNHVHTRAELKEYDVGLSALIAEAFPNNEWRYVRPDRRKDLGHLEGFDRKAAPRFAWRPDEPFENGEKKPE
jgi:hypothetical protein